MPIVGNRISTTTEYFYDVINSDLTFVDKSLLIKDLIDDGNNAILLPRSRRFGKSLNMSMLQHFFAANVKGRATAELFNELQISKINNGEYIKNHQGQYPVICISFRDIKEADFTSALNKIKLLIADLYSDHQNILTSEELTEKDKVIFEAYLNGGSHRDTPEKYVIDSVTLQNALYFLCKLLYKVYSKNIVLLIDEYDTPLTSAYRHNYLDQISDFMRGLFGPTLKGNPYLYKGVLTGILRISKNNMLSGLNNLKVHTILDAKYSQYFGFSEEEVRELLEKYNCSEQSEKVKAFYNGYVIGKQVIYNPWSVMNYLSEKELRSYWVMTANDHLLRELLLGASADIKEQFNQLIQGKKITADISLNLRYEQMLEQESALWTLLLFCGYLKAENAHESALSNDLECELSVPNTEVMKLYSSIFISWLQQSLGEQKSKQLIDTLLAGNISTFTTILNEFLLTTVSVHDTAGPSKAESFYHGFVLALIASASQTHYIKSNREAGYGRYDVSLIPKDTSKYSLGIILEFKTVKAAEQSIDIAKSALKQIIDRQYATDFKQHSNIESALVVGLAFTSKAMDAAWQSIDVITGEVGELNTN